jgi:hypothetical protein
LFGRGKISNERASSNRRWRSAYPIGDQTVDPLRIGMSLLDYFAAAALPIATMAWNDTPRPADRTLGQHIAMIAYGIAGRMIEERKRRAKP